MSTDLVTRRRLPLALVLLVVTSIVATACGNDGTEVATENGGEGPALVLTSSEVCERLDASAATTAVGANVTAAMPGNEPGDPTPPSCVYTFASGFVTLALMRPDDDLLGRSIGDGYALIVDGAASALPEGSEPEAVADVGDEAVWIEGERFAQMIARGGGAVVTTSGTSNISRDEVTSLTAAFLDRTG
jgi:hypothetical protein